MWPFKRKPDALSLLMDRLSEIPHGGTIELTREELFAAARCDLTGPLVRYLGVLSEGYVDTLFGRKWKIV